MVATRTQRPMRMQRIIDNETCVKKVIYDHIKNQVMYAKQDSPMLNKIVSKLPQS